MIRIPAGLGAISAAALFCVLDASPSSAQGQQPAAGANLPTVQVQAPRQRQVRQVRRTRPVRAARRAAPRPAPAPVVAPATPAPVVTSRAGTSVGYVGVTTSTATKTDTPLINVPQSVSVVTRQQLDDQGVQSVADAVRYIPGVAVAQGEGNRDALVIRGQATTADFFVDGVRDDVQYYRDLYNIERIEVLKGPNAMIFGRGGGGGVVNRVLKAPEWSPFSQATLEGGSYGNARATFDTNYVASQGMAFRLNGMYENSDSYRKFVHLDRYGINPTVSFQISPQTKVTLGYEHFHDERTADRGIPSMSGRPFPTDRSTFFGNPWESYTYSTGNIGTALIEHETSSGVKIRNYTRAAQYEKFYQNIFPGAVTGGGTTVNLAAYNNATDRVNLFNQTDVTWQFMTGAIKHKMLVGIEGGRQDTDNFRNTGYFGACGGPTSFSVPTANPITTTPVTFCQSATDANANTIVTTGAAYVQDQIELNRYFQVIAGLRFDHFNIDYHNNRNGQDLSRSDGLWSPRVGLIYKPVDNVSIYGAYSVSYLPSSGDQFGSLTVNNSVLKPEKFTNYEVGVKWDILRYLALNAAVYQLDRENTTANDPNNPGVIVQTGSTRTRGFETSLTGYITNQWQVIGGYAYTDARISSDTTAAPAGRRVALVPQHAFSLWNRYQINEAWGVGLGVIHQSDIYAAIDNTVTLPSFTRVDAALFYQLNPDVRAQLNIENIFDKDYYPTAHSNNNILPGAGRTFRLKLIARM